MAEHKDLDLDEDLEGHRKGHKYKIAGFFMFSLFLLSVLLGSTGNGVLSEDKQSDPSTGESIETEKFTRYECPMEIRLHVNTTRQVKQDSLYDVSFPASYLKNYTIESILPEPAGTAIAGDRMVFQFKVQSPSTDQLIIFHLRSSRAMRTVSADVMLESKAEFSISQFIYP
jgi:hypothetical protein